MSEVPVMTAHGQVAQATRMRGFVASLTVACIGLLVAAGTSSAAFPARAYELVSQYPTGSVPISELNNTAVVGVDGVGDHLLYYSPTPFPISEAPPYSPNRDYLATRGDDGWSSAETELPIFGEGRRAGAPSSAARPLTTTSEPIDPDDQNGAPDVYQRQPDGEWVWLSRDPRIPVGTPQTVAGTAEVASTRPVMSAMSTNGDVAVFQSDRQLVDADEDGGWSMYKYDAGTLGYVGAAPKAALGGGFGNGADGAGDPVFSLNAVSRDGATVIWKTSGPSSTSHLQMRVGDLPAADITGAAFNLFYQGATYDSSRVLFTSSTRLTDDSGASGVSSPNQSDLYLYDRTSDSLRDLTPRLDGGDDPEIDPALEDRARVLGVAAFSQEESGPTRVYFIASGVFGSAGTSPEGEAPVQGGNNLYTAEIGDVDGPIAYSFIATLNDDDAGYAVGLRPPSASTSFDTWQARTAYASPDGTVLGIGATDALTEADSAGVRQLFVYDANARSLICASCPADGSAPATRDVNKYLALIVAEPTLRWQLQSGNKRWVSTDGTVFFDTATPLLAADKNDADDVYAFKDGELDLISSGSAVQSGTNGSHFVGASADGSSVFFSTAEALAANDEEPGIRKLYVARVGGGFPPPPPPSEPCLWDECQGSPTSPPEDPAIGSGLGDPTGPGQIDARCNRIAERAANSLARARKAGERASKLKRQSRRVQRKAKRASGPKAGRLFKRSRHLDRRARRQARTSTALRKRSTAQSRRAAHCRGASR